MHYFQQLMSKNQKRYSKNSRTVLEEPQENPRLRHSLGQEAQQQLRQISQKYQMDSYSRELQWSAKPQKNIIKNLSQQGCFEVNLSKINKKLNSGENKLFKITRQSQCQPKQPKSLLEVRQEKLLQLSKRRRKSQTYASINYELRSSRYKQSRIHSISDINIESNNSHFIVNEDVFKEAAAKLHKRLQYSRHPFNCDSQKNERVQSELIVHKKVEKSPEIQQKEQGSLGRMNFISLSPHNLPYKKFNFTPLIHPIKRNKANFPIQIAFHHKGKNIP